MPQNPNYDPKTGLYHADSMWKRYDPKYNPPADIKQYPSKALDYLIGLIPPPEAPELPDSPELPTMSKLGPAPASVVPNRTTPVPTTAPLQGLQSAQSPPNAPAMFPKGPTSAPSMGPGVSANDPIKLAALRDTRAGELEDQIAAGGDDVSRLSALLGNVRRDINEAPFTGQAAQAEQAGLEKRRQAAVEQGYEDTGGIGPIQTANKAAREFEQYKADAPVRAQEKAGEFDLAKQRAANEGALAVAQSKGEQYKDFLDMLNASRASGADVSHMTFPGGGGVTYAQDKPIPTPLLARVNDTYNNYKAASGRLFGGGADQEKAVFTAALGQALGADRQIPPNVLQEIVSAFSEDPSLMEAPINEFEFVDMSPEEQQMAVNAIIKVRGF